MENHPTSSSSTDKFEEFSDLNCGEGVEQNNSGNAKQVEGSSVANDDAQAEKEVASIDLTIEEMESRLEPGKFVENEHIAHALYCKYASAKGFNVRKGKNVMFKDGSGLQGKFFVCSCEGHKDEKRSKNKIPAYQKTTSRSCCKAQLKITRRKNSLWMVARFDKEHNHEMYAPDQTYMLRSGRNITDEQQIAITAMLKSGISAAESIRLLENLAQGRENVGFTAQDVYNYIRKSKIDSTDSLALVDYFKERSNKEADFYWNMELDDENRLMNFFFRDSRSLNDYMCFGDVLSLDTTYRTNKYELICAPFVGINHHNKNVMFGLAFMSDETTNSFEWLLRKFLESMHDKQPQIIFTDQCQAMMKAIGTVFPLAHHRLCQWHINQNAPSHFGSLNNDSEFHHLWGKCMNDCETEDEFEATWGRMMTFDIGDKNKSWFNTMYNLRYKWASVFSNNIFSAGLLATSRSEGTNSVLKSGFGNKTSTLLNCVIGYQEIQSKWRLHEKEKDTFCRHNKPTLFVKHPLLKHASNFYTNDIYNMFAKEFQDTLSMGTPQQLFGGPSLSRYMVKPKDSKLKSRIVECDSENVEVRCSCHKFETFGILCSHALKVFCVFEMDCIPEKYIKKRWTKEAKFGLWQCENGEESWKRMNVGDSSYLSGMAYFNSVSRDFCDVASRSIARKKARDEVLKAIECLKKVVDDIFEDTNSNDDTPSDFAMGKDNNNLDGVLVRDPIIAKTRGITNVNKRHWEDKSKKGKGKAESSRRTTKNAKRKNQSSQQGEENCPSQETTNVQQNQLSQEMLLPSQHNGFFPKGTTNQDLIPPNGYPNNMSWNFFN